MPSELPHDAASCAGENKSQARTILVAEDGEDFRLMPTAFLEGRGHQVLCDPVLKDLGLPKLDGLSAARGIVKKGEAATA